jgi:hypothetical protein
MGSQMQLSVCLCVFVPSAVRETAKEARLAVKDTFDEAVQYIEETRQNVQKEVADAEVVR